jgi:decaprenyl-phosphate phosphoribosyltransferase
MISAIVLLDITKISTTLIYNFIFGIASACLIASANYVINEWLDAEFDRHHPIKKFRAGALGNLKARWVYLEYAICVASGLLLAYFVNNLFFLVSLFFLISGIFYNVKPFRTKDRVYLDVITEAINNPIRLLLGWAIVSGQTIAPLSLILAYWSGGAFLMAAKRLWEYSFLTKSMGKEFKPGLYRKSFAFYSIESLIVSCFCYSMISIFGVAILLIKYRTEYILMVPAIIVLFGYYFHLCFKASNNIESEKFSIDSLYLWPLVAVIFLLFLLASFTSMPALDNITQSKSINLNLDFFKID